MLAFSGASSPTARSARTRLARSPIRRHSPREIELVRERGYAEAVGEREPGLTAIAAPIRAARGELEAIVALQGPSSRFDDAAVDNALPPLLERASAISRELGWSTD